MNVVAVSGWKGSGKDLVAEYLVEKYGFQRVAFADPLKDTVATQFNIERKSIDNRFTKEAALLDLPVTPKDAYSANLAGFLVGEFVLADDTKLTPAQINMSKIDGQVNFAFISLTYGQLYWTRRALCILEGSTKRTADPEYWIKQAVIQMKNGNYVISDARFTNEVETLGKLLPNSLTSIRIDRFEDSSSNDPSERDLDNFPFPFRINNKITENKTIIEVYSQVDAVMTLREIKALQS